MRPVLFFPAWSTLLLAYVFERNIYSWELLIFNYDLLVRLVSFAVVMGASFIINQIADLETDKKNKKLPILSSELVTEKEAWFFSILLLSLVLAFSYYYDVYIFMLNVIFFTITGVLYNLPPFSLKNKMILGALANYTMGILAYLYACSKFEIIDSESFIILSMINFSLFILTTLPDIKGDKLTEKRTIGSVLGIKKSLIINLLLMIMLLVISRLYFYSVSIVYYLFICQLIFSIFLFVKEELEKIIFVIKLFLLIQALAVCLFFPDYFILVLLMYLGGRRYYQNFFNINYPHIKNE